MNYLSLFLFGIALLLIYMYFEAGWLKIEYTDFAKGCSGLKILHISDVHISMLRVPVRKVKRIINSENPDAIILTGDYVDKPADALQFLNFLKTIKQNYKTCLCLGNHDHMIYEGNKNGIDSFMRKIEALQVDVLQNCSTQLEKNGRKYNLTGVEDLREGRPDFEKAMKGCPPADTSIVITHNPDLVLQTSYKNIDYMFCGHTHGGQIWAPFNLEFILLRKDKLCKKGVKRGLHKINGINLYINRGLGNVLVPLRFLSRPEITVYNI